MKIVPEKDSRGLLNNDSTRFVPGRDSGGLLTSDSVLELAMAGNPFSYLASGTIHKLAFQAKKSDLPLSMTPIVT
ncbi:hypothetical protein ACFLXA_06570 [Chloroflexota bacterium]